MNGQRWPWGLIMVLSAVCAGQGHYIYAHKEDSKHPQKEERSPLERWRDQTGKDLFQGGPFPFKRFDNIFNDDFFSQQFDPFAEIRRFQRRFSPLFRDAEKSLFDRSWLQYFDGRMNVQDIRTSIERKGDEIIITLKIPGLENESFSIDINADRIRISYRSRTVTKEEDASGNAYRHSESVSQYQKIMPIPYNADPNTSRMEKGKDSIKIIFKKKTTSGHSKNTDAPTRL